MRIYNIGLVFVLALGATVACGGDDDDDSATGGKGGKSSAGKGGASGKGGVAGKSGNAGKGGSSGAGKGGTGTGGSTTGGSAGSGNAGASVGGSSGATAGAGGEGGDGGATSGAGGEGGNDGLTTCNNLPLNGPTVPETQHAGVAPIGEGGEIQDGAYHLVSWDVYDGETAGERTRKVTLVIEGNSLMIAAKDSDNPDVVRLSATLTTLDEDLFLAMTCPQAQLDTATYTATETTLAIMRADESRIEHYTLD